MGGPSTPPGKQYSGCRHALGLRAVDPQPALEGLWLPACQAIPGGIPDPLLRDQADHASPYPGDGGARRESAEPISAPPHARGCESILRRAPDGRTTACGRPLGADGRLHGQPAMVTVKNRAKALR